MYSWLLNRIKLHKRAQIRSYMRGYNFLSKNDNLELDKLSSTEMLAFWNDSK